MIEKLNITEFRGIRKCEKEIDLSKFTVLTGRNNSGKTAILEAIYLLGGNRKVFTIKNSVLSIENLHSGKSNSLIYGYSGTAKIEYLVNNKRIKQEIYENGTYKVFVEDIEKNWMDILKIIGIDEKIFEKWDERESNKAFMFIPTHSSYIENLIERIEKEEYERMTKAGAHIKIIELVNKCVNDKFTDIYLQTLRVRKELHGNVLYIPLEDLGSGLVKIIPILLWIETFSPKVLLWDDFEMSAHPGLIKILIEYLSKKDIQIIISTHSIDVLSELIDVKPNDASVLLISKTNDDVLKYSKLNLEELEKMMEDANHDPRLVSEALQL